MREVSWIVHPVEDLATITCHHNTQSHLVSLLGSARKSCNQTVGAVRDYRINRRGRASYSIRSDNSSCVYDTCKVPTCLLRSRCGTGLLNSNGARAHLWASFLCTISNGGCAILTLFTRVGGRCCMRYLICYDATWINKLAPALLIPDLR